MKYLDLLDAYRRFKENSAVADEKRNIVQDYEVMVSWLRENHEDNRLFVTLYGGITYLAVKTILERKINMKDLSGGRWDTNAVHELYNILKHLNAVRQSGDKNGFMVWFTRFFQLVGSIEVEFPACALYCWQCYTEKDSLLYTYHRDVNMLLRCKTDEEVIKVLEEIDAPKTKEREKGLGKVRTNPELRWELMRRAYNAYQNDDAYEMEAVLERYDELYRAGYYPEEDTELYDIDVLVTQRYLECVRNDTDYETAYPHTSDVLDTIIIDASNVQGVC